MKVNESDKKPIQGEFDFYESSKQLARIAKILKVNTEKGTFYTNLIEFCGDTERTLEKVFSAVLA